ncbi:MAG: hypothetical protein RDU25_04285 [Patescibacteria group bacterium]|nr:hypothetical protein [Patescibacteria group bacterium]
MEQPFEFPIDQVPSAVEQPTSYDPEEDPLKNEVSGILDAYRHKKFARLFNPKTKMFEKPDDADAAEEIFRIRYPNGLGHPQKGNFAVVATALDEHGRNIGGGWVESFETEYEAERCAYIIRKINPDHEPEVASNKDW